MGYYGDYLSAEIVVKHFKVGTQLQIIQSATRYNDEVSIALLSFEYSYSNKHNLFLSVNLRDFFDKLFLGKRILSGNTIFDKKYMINSSNKSLALNLFCDTKVQEMVANNPCLVFNISTADNMTKVMMKYTEKDKLYSEEELRKLYDDFGYVLSSIKKTIELAEKA